MNIIMCGYVRVGTSCDGWKEAVDKGDDNNVESGQD